MHCGIAISERQGSECNPQRVSSDTLSETTTRRWEDTCGRGLVLTCTTERRVVSRRLSGWPGAVVSRGPVLLSVVDRCSHARLIVPGCTEERWKELPHMLTYADVCWRMPTYARRRYPQTTYP